MLRVALTGGVASGKTAAAARLRELGAQVSSSDEVGRALMQPGTAVFRAVRDLFGASILLESGELNRPALARIAFEQGRLEELNAIVHPAVIAAQAEWMEAVGRLDPLAVAVVESALVFETQHGSAEADETPWRTRFDRIVVVTAPLEARRDRYAQRIGGSTMAATADFDRRSGAQWTDEQKIALADHVLQNEGSLDDLHARVDSLFLALRQEAADRATEAM